MRADPLADVAHAGQHAGTALQHKRPQDDFFLDFAAVFTAARALDGQPRQEPLFEFLKRALLKTRRRQFARRHVQQFVPAVAVAFDRTRVHVQDAAIEVGDDDGVRGGLEDRLQPVLAFTQGLLRALTHTQFLRQLVHQPGIEDRKRRPVGQVFQQAQILRLKRRLIGAVTHQHQYADTPVLGDQRHRHQTVHGETGQRRPELRNNLLCKRFRSGDGQEDRSAFAEHLRPDDGLSNADGAGPEQVDRHLSHGVITVVHGNEIEVLAVV